jgi:hypothetical protein
MNPHRTLTRRGLLRQAVGGAALVSALHATKPARESPAHAQNPRVLRLRLEVPQGRRARRPTARVLRLRLARRRPAPRLEHRGPLQRAGESPGKPSHRHRLVSQALPRARVLQGPHRRHRVRRHLSEQRSVDQRPVPGQAPLRLRRLLLRSSPHLKAAGDNVIAVKVDNSRHPTAAGIPAPASTATPGCWPPTSSTWPIGAPSSPRPASPKTPPSSRSRPA